MNKILICLDEINKINRHIQNVEIMKELKYILSYKGI